MLLKNNYQFLQDKMDLKQNEIKNITNYTTADQIMRPTIIDAFLTPTIIPSFAQQKPNKSKQNYCELKINSNRLKCKGFNDILSCYLCKGYLINPTTITNENCFHSFCRSCIVNFIINLSDKSYCPKCGEGTKTIKLSDLKSDEILKSIVYKLIPGLHNKELKRCLNFVTDKNILKCQDLRNLEEEDYFAPGEPISLSLEYHPRALNKELKDQIPLVRYLQCPAALTIHHLKRFLYTKFDINHRNQRVNIEVIYEDEVLSNDFTLMDVGYCYKWKRAAPMRFFYQILLYNAIPSLNKIEKIVLSKEPDQDTEAKFSKTNEAVAKKTVKFKNIGEKAVENKLINFKPIVSNAETKLESDKEKSYNFLENESSFKNEISVNRNNVKNDISYNIGKSYNNNNSIFINNNCNNLKDTDKELLNDSVDNTFKNSEDIKHIYENESDMYNDRKEAEIRKNDKNYEAEGGKIVTLSNLTANTDFKSLRSNNDFQSQSLINMRPSLKIKSLSPKSKDKINKASIVELNKQKSVSKCDIVVSIPQNHIHRASNSSDDSFENLSLAQLKTANKKNSSSISPRENINNQTSKNEHYDLHSKVSKNKEHKDQKSANRKDKDIIEKEKNKEELPEFANTKTDPLKVKIDKTSLKTKFTLQKKVNDKPETKKLIKERTYSTEELHPSSNEVDLTTYAKVIGLKPIKPIQSEKKDLISKPSPGASPASATSSCSSSASFTFSAEVSSSSSHKKRKKAKHSKELKELKKRKLHAEIASEPVNQPDGIKLKVKITPSHKIHKAEKKLSNNDIQISSIETQDNIKTVEGISSSKENSSNVENDLKKLERAEDMQTKVVESSPLAKENRDVEEKEKSTQEQNIAKTQNFVNKKQNFIPKTIATNSIAKFVASNSASVTTAIIKNSQFTSQQSTNFKKENTQKLHLNSQESKIPISPPLPPSLFKTTPLNLPKQSATSSVTNSPKNMLMAQRQSMSQHQQMAMNQMNRITNKSSSRNGTAANFIVPNPPRGIVSNASKHYPIGSIASQQHRAAAQLKRSASLDSSPPTYAKQLKLEQDRLIRKSAYASKLSNHLQPKILLPATTQQVINRSSPTAVVFSSVQTNKPQTEQIFYTSAMGSTYTHETAMKKSVPILLPPSSISVTKMVDTFPNSIITSPSGLTITPQDKQPPVFQFQSSNKPALEIVRIQSKVLPIDQQFSIISNNPIKQTPNKASRPPPPPIPLKIKKPLNQSQTVQPILSTVTSAAPQSAQLLNMSQSNTSSTENSESKPIEILDLSGKSRSPSREKSLSPETQNVSQDIIQNNAINLETALNQLLQQQNHVTSSSNLSVQSSKIANDKQNQEENVGLQNLQLLSESATNREKLAVKTNRAIPMLSKLDVGKIRANANVRQQNASVRNIPNPSALAFRGNQQPPIPMLANISKTSPQTLNLSVNENIPKTQLLNSNINSSTTAMSPTTTTIADSSRMIASKKNLEQLAQNLNIRAAAAADNSAKNSHTTNSSKNCGNSAIGSLVTSTTKDVKSNTVSSSFNVTSTSSSMSNN